MKLLKLSGIVGYDFNQNTLQEFLDSAGGEDIQVNLMTPGGYIDVAFAMANSIRDYEGKTTVMLNGTVASAGAYFASSFDEMLVRDNSIFMIHNAIGGAYGDYRVLEKEAKTLKSYNPNIAASYANKSGIGLDEIISLMDDETWYFGAEIVDAGFGDRMIEENKSSDTDKETAVENARKVFNMFAEGIGDDLRYKRVALALKNDPKPGDPGEDIGEGMKKEEILNHLKTMKENNSITLTEIADTVGLSDQVVTEDHREAVEVVNEIKTALDVTEDIVSAVKNLKKQISDNESLYHSNKLDSLFGKDNDLREYAGERLNVGFTDEELEKFKENSIAQRLAEDLADINSAMNIIVEDKDKKNGKKKKTVYNA